MRPPSAFLQGLVALASVCVIVAGLDAAENILLPILFSVFLAILGVPMVRVLGQYKVPTWASIPIVVVVFSLLLVGATALSIVTLRGFTDDIDKYRQPFADLVESAVLWLQGFGIKTDLSAARSIVQPDMIMGLIGQTLNAVIAVGSRALIVIVTMTFILFEATELELKFEAAFGTAARRLGPFTDATRQVQRYLVIKSLASLFTGIFITIGCWLIGLDFPVLWGVIAMLFNFVPSIGSIVAAIPAILLALVQLSPRWAIVVTVLYLVVNITIGNFLEPRFMGRSLGLSPLVVFLSLIFWGWLWGPVGMLFCVPMTVIAKLFLESQEDTRWIAVFLGSPREILDQRAATAVAAPGREHTP